MKRWLELFTDESNSAQKWRDVFSTYPGQLEFALDTGLRFGPSLPGCDSRVAIDAYLSFEGMVFRWINASDEVCALLIVPVTDRNNTLAEYEAATRLISRLVFETGQPIRVINCVGSPAMRRPFLNQHYPLHLRVSNLSELTESKSRALNMAYAFYKEGINSASVFYSFLSFWKVLHLAFEEDTPRASIWVHASLPLVCSPEDLSALKSRSNGKDEVKYLYSSCRCAIAHTKLTQIVADPDDAEDYCRITADQHIVRPLAKLAIQTKAGILCI